MRLVEDLMGRRGAQLLALGLQRDAQRLAAALLGSVPLRARRQGAVEGGGVWWGVVEVRKVGEADSVWDSLLTVQLLPVQFL